jgi:hypothetical protein
MHPVHYLFEDIYRDWGIPRADGPVRERGVPPLWQRSRPAKRAPQLRIIDGRRDR